MKATEIQPFTHVTLTFCERRLDTSGQNNFFECDVSLLLEANDMIDVTHAMQPTRFNMYPRLSVSYPTNHLYMNWAQKNKARHTEKKNNNNKNKNKNNIANCRKNSKNFNTKQHWRMY